MFENSDLINKLPKVRGRLTVNAPLGNKTWFGVGGNAEVLFKPADKQDLIEFVKAYPKDVPLTIIGVASNLIIRDGGIKGVVIRMGKGFNEIEVLEDNSLKLGAAVLDKNLSLTALENNIAGLEFLHGIPGTVGGALRMNAGAYGDEVKDVLVSTEVLFSDGSVKEMTAEEMGLSYRNNDLPSDVIFLSCILKGRAGEYEVIKARMDELQGKRESNQPIYSKTCGSTFANPEGHSAGRLIEAAGLKGFKIGDAQVSEMHSNFIINTGNASAADLERLGEEVRRVVYEKNGIMLTWEIRRIGEPLDSDEDIKSFIKKEKANE